MSAWGRTAAATRARTVRFTDAQLAVMERKYREGVTLLDLALEYGIGPEGVRWRLSWRGVPIRKGGRRKKGEPRASA